MTTLVTGSSGHLGRAVITLLRQAGRPAVGLDTRPAATTDIVGSITDAATVARAMQGATGVIHSATLHKPHVATHSRQDFVDTNITGTLTLLSAATRAEVGAFVFTSTTSAFGRALTPGAGDPAAWITEAVADRPKNIYGATKTGAEALCDLAAHRDGLPMVILRSARFFPEPDDSAAARASFSDANLKANEFLHRRLDLEDAARAYRRAWRCPGPWIRSLYPQRADPVATGRRRRPAPRSRNRDRSPRAWHQSPLVAPGLVAA